MDDRWGSLTFQNASVPLYLSIHDPIFKNILYTKVSFKQMNLRIFLNFITRYSRNLKLKNNTLPSFLLIWRYRTNKKLDRKRTFEATFWLRTVSCFRLWSGGVCEMNSQNIQHHVSVSKSAWKEKKKVNWISVFCTTSIFTFGRNIFTVTHPQIFREKETCNYIT